MNILVDEDLPRAVVDVLKKLGHEAEHVLDAGLRGAADRLIFASAQERSAVLLTADLDFANIVRFPPGSHSGIVVLRFPDYFRRNDVLELVRRFFRSAAPTSIAGALTVVTPGSYRVRR